MKCNNTEAKQHKGFFDDCIHKRKLTLSFHPSGSDPFKNETLKLGFLKSLHINQFAFLDRKYLKHFFFNNYFLSEIKNIS